MKVTVYTRMSCLVCNSSIAVFLLLLLFLVCLQNREKVIHIARWQVGTSSAICLSNNYFYSLASKKINCEGNLFHSWGMMNHIFNITIISMPIIMI